MSIANDVRLYIKGKPYIRDALEKDIANLSSLARIIQKELSIEKFEAVKAALRRISEDLKKSKQRREEKVLDVLKETTIAVYDGISVVISDEPIELKERMKVNLSNSFVYILDKNDLPEIKDAAKVYKDCVMIVTHSPKNLEETPGVIAFMASLLAEENINVLEFISCWTDTIFIVEKKDALKSYEILSKIIG